MADLGVQLLVELREPHRVEIGERKVKAGGMPSLTPVNLKVGKDLGYRRNLAEINTVVPTSSPALLDSLDSLNSLDSLDSLDSL